MNTQDWISISAYSGKYRVSVSTLRRRIKSGELEHQFLDGRYLIRDAPLTDQVGEQLEVDIEPSKPVAPPLSQADGCDVKTTPPVAILAVDKQAQVDSVNYLLGEIKKAYSLVLQEKEEQILQLKEEVFDLKTLVRVLEEENERLKLVAEKSTSSESDNKLDLDHWIDSLET